MKFIIELGESRKKNACLSTIELEGLIQTKFHLDKGQKYLLQEYDKEESLFLDVDDINEVEDRARLKVIVTSDKDAVNDEDRNSCLPQKMRVNNDITTESSAQMKQNLIMMMKWMLGNLFSFLCGEIRLTRYFYRFCCQQK